MQGYNYKLETHLKILCEENKEFKNLCSSWELNKTTYKNILNTIQLNYPHYSLHDSTHSESIITNIEMILGEDRIKKLSPSDTWLILNCAYLHDFGMAILHSNIEDEWKSDKFQKYLKKLTKSSDRNLREAAQYIEELPKNLNKEGFDITWPLKIRKYVTQIIADYYRGKHSSLTKEYLSKLNEWELDLTQNGLIKERFINLIGDISSLHTQNFEEVMKLDYQGNGYNGDYIHPRFVAVMLRMGDLLDLDNGRFSKFVENVNGNLPEKSANHKAKHKATTHVLVNTTVIDFRADCESDGVYREVRNWMSWLDNEIKNISFNIQEIFPSKLGGYIAKLNKCELFLNGKPDLEGKTDLKFRISQKKAFDIIEGSNIYDDKLVFIREFLQNAIDASKIQLWKDLNNGIYDFILRDKLEKDNNRYIYSKLTPFDLLEKNIFNNYGIRIFIGDIFIEDIKDFKTGLIIQDRGNGINLDKLKAMCDVGESYDHRTYEKEFDIDSMPAWLKPTGSFGIGMQSAFLVTEKFEAITKYDGYPAMKINFEKSTNGYISVREADENEIIEKGTKFIILIDDVDNFVNDLNSNEYRNDEKYITSEEKIFKENNKLFECIDKYIKENIEYSFFYIYLYDVKNNEKTCRRIIGISHKQDHDYKDKRYLRLKHVSYENKKQDDNYNLAFWDKCLNMFIEINYRYISNSYNPYLDNNKLLNRIYFKGFSIDDTFENEFHISADIHGLNSRDNINLNRKGFKPNAKNKVGKAIEDAIRVYLDNVSKELIDNINSYSKEYIENIILLSVKYYNSFDNYRDIVDKFSSEFNENKGIIVIKKVDNVYEYKKIDYKELYESISERIAFLQVGGYFNIFEMLNDEKWRKEKIIAALNSKKDLPNYEIILLELGSIGKIEHLYKMNYIGCIDKKNEIYICSKVRKGNDIMEVDKIIKKDFINMLIYERIDFIGRSWIPAIKEYSLLAVDEVPYSISENINKYFINIKYNKEKIISPIPRDIAIQIINYNKPYNNVTFKNYMRKNDLIEKITRDEKFKEIYNDLILYTQSHGVEKKHTYDEIDEKYKELISEFYDLYS